MKLRPLHDRVVVKRLEQETKTASGIVIPDAAAEKPDQGEVLAVGPGKRNDKGDFVVLNVKVGDRVLFGKYSGQTVKVDGDELLVMREEDLFAVVEKLALHAKPWRFALQAGRLRRWPGGRCPGRGSIGSRRRPETQSLNSGETSHGS